jgi:hypothetical protein
VTAVNTTSHTVPTPSRHDLLGAPRHSPLRFVLVPAAVVAAMDRILNSIVERSNGALTITPRPENRVLSTRQRMRSHHRFETSLRTAIVKLKDTIANKNKEFKQLRVDVPALVRAVNQLTLGNQQLRERLQRPTSDVIPFPNRQSPHPNG